MIERSRSGADFQGCRVAGFPTRSRPVIQSLADWEVGDTAGWETGATFQFGRSARLRPRAPALSAGNTAPAPPPE